jgi:hypothetical protein
MSGHIRSYLSHPMQVTITELAGMLAKNVNVTSPFAATEISGTSTRPLALSFA